MKIKYFVLTFALLLLTGCESFYAAVDAISNFFGANTPEGAPSPATSTFGTVGAWLPGSLTLGLIALSKMVHSGFKLKKAFYESTQHAIDSGSLVNAKTEDDVKAALNLAQSMHGDSKLLVKAYDQHKNGGLLARFWKKILSYIS